VLAEVELPAPGTPVTIPRWLEPQLEREVTDDPAYSNFHLAMEGSPSVVVATLSHGRSAHVEPGQIR